ncbi:MAG: insulinase family protein [Betaproteobacteria bacterium]|nr:MAG: insulinase family protein [Betaproteobacteria bacterium]
MGIRMFRRLFALLAALAVSAALAQGAAQERKLANGLRVIVKEDHRAPTVVHMVWYVAGSMDEVSGESGVAHVLEHMMFKGTKTVKSGVFSRRIAAAGGRENAFTSRDYTAYFQQVPKAALPLVLRLEADRMSNLLVTEAEFSREIKVVMEERRLRTEDQPHALVSEALNATAYFAHPYRRPVIGWMNDLENMSHHDARNWYARWYVPNNAFVVVVGDVKAEEVFALAQKYYGRIKARPLPERKPQLEPEQRGARRVVVKAPAELPYLLMGWKCPVLRDVDKDWQPYALEVLTSVLDGNESARLNQSLVRNSRIASSVGAGYDATARGAGMCYLDGTPSQGRSAAELETALRAELARLVEGGVSAEELERVKAQVVASQIFKRDSIFGQAMEIGQFETAGLSHQDIDRVLDRIKAVSAEQVRAVAKQYFVDDDLTVVVLEPQPLERATPRPAPPGVRH